MEEETTIDYFVAVRSKGGMDNSLFQYYIRNIVLPLYPNISNESLTINGKVIKGPVIFKTDNRPGRMKEDITHINVLEKMNNIGLKLILSLPNATSVHAELDQCFDYTKEIVDHDQRIIFQKKYRTRS